ncbi:skin secretory protein xP2-like [Chiroxiphia lanceolata]|uniref:skin secretory protein xP2-like n=1 Tax=Chiroxiphia lanceolata TaxID=296741 RepID=UPI0013CE7BE6|nr:skin secretory protein xP2-like [Chiroxiphia lanceolata]
MWRPDPWAGPGASPGLPGCPDLLQHAQALHSQGSPLFLSFFEDECRLIADRLRLAEAAAPTPDPWEADESWAEPAGPVTSTPLPAPSDGRAPDSGTSTCEAAAVPGPARAEPVCLPQPAVGAGPGARPLSRARRGAAQPSGGRPGPAVRSPGRGRARLAPTCTRASQGLQLPSAGTAGPACPKRLLQPADTRLKGMPPATSRVQHPGGALKKAQPSALPEPAPRDTQMKSNSAPVSWPHAKRGSMGGLMRQEGRRGLAWAAARPRTEKEERGVLGSGAGRSLAAVKAGGHKQPSSRLPTAIPVLASRSSLRPLGRAASSQRSWISMGSTTQELSRCEDAVPAEQSAGDQLSQELERVKKELERVKGELADKTAQCEAYHQTICSLQAQLRAAGVCVEDAAVFKGGDLGRDDSWHMGTCPSA